jgi:glycosyltransferase involved in cell wall biosynthesis
LNGRNGEYGGPVSVAREICAELNARGHQTQIFSGALLGSEPIAQDGLNESYLIVEPISQKLKISSLWNWKIVGELSEKIKKADIVHIHFARDLIPLAAALLCVLLRRPFVTQTHGMVVSDGRKSTRLTDLFLTKPLINRSKINLVLSKKS